MPGEEVPNNVERSGSLYAWSSEWVNQRASSSWEEPTTTEAESVSTSGQTTPTASTSGASTPTGTAKTGSGISDLDWDRFSFDEPEERLVNRIEKLLGRLSETSRTTLLERQLKKGTLHLPPRIGTITISDNKENPESLKSDIPYVKRRWDKQEIPLIAPVLSGFSIPANEDPSLFIFPTNQKKTTFDILSDTWMFSSKRVGHKVKIDWLELQDEHTRNGAWQHGSWFLKRTGPGHHNINQIEANGAEGLETSIVFPTPYAKPPKVVVFLSGLYCTDCRFPLSLAIEHKYISKTDFKLRVQCSAASGRTATIQNLQVTWIAYPSSLPGVYSGSVNTDSLRTAAQHVNMGYIPFPVSKFSKPPKVMVGLNHLNFAGRKEHNIKAFVSNVTHLGMCWNADSWGETVNHGAGISYLAIED